MLDKSARELFQEAFYCEASDLHLTVKSPPVVRVHGKLKVMKDYPHLEPDDTMRVFEEIANDELQRELEEYREVDFAYSLQNVARFRVNAFYQRGSIALVARSIPTKVLSLDELRMPKAVADLARKQKGLVLVTGPTGSGKSTTLAAMIDLMNKEQSLHIVTLENPIEYLHAHGTCLINQREIGPDVTSFARGLRAALREDPDVILVGEMRDHETISTAITAAETGHLVLATLHTQGAAETIDRIIDVFPPHQQAQIRTQLAGTIQGVLSQQLLPVAQGTGRVAALEILVATPAVRNLVREGKTYQLTSVMETGRQWGMQTMDFSLKQLLANGTISKDEYNRRVQAQLSI